MDDFQASVAARIASYPSDAPLCEAAARFARVSIASKYSYNFSWLGRPIIQYPQDVCAVQEIIWQTRPDLVIETGIAHGGSLIFSASMLALLDVCDAIAAGGPWDPRESARQVLGVDIDIRPPNLAAIQAHPMAGRIQMIQGSSIAAATIEQVRAVAARHARVLVCLDSNHTHDHVLAELEAYAPLTSVGSYCVVFDTIVEDLPPEMYPDRPWGPGNSPKTAVREYLRSHPEFEVDTSLHQKLLLTVAPEGYLKRVRA